MFETYIKKIDIVNLFVLACIWWNLNQKIDGLDKRMNDLDKRLTVVEMLLLQQNRLQSYIVKENPQN